MRKVIGIGETVLDIIFKDNQPVSAVPGGSAFNATISLGRCGINTTFISEAGNDRIGERVIAFLRDNGVNADHVAVFPEINKDDIVLFGSFFAVNPVVRPQMAGFLEYAREHGAIIYYDVNYRSSHKNDIMKITPNLLDNLDYADIVRGSKEDFAVLYKMDDPDKVYNSEISFYCKKFICTRGAEPLVVHDQDGFRKEYAVPPMRTVSTIGAGDNFNAGFIYGMIKYGITREDIEGGMSEKKWDQVVACGLEFSAECCKDITNSVSPAFGKAKRL